MSRKSKALNVEDTKYILSISREDCARKSILMDLFGDFGKGPKFQPYDTMIVPAKSYGNTKKNKSAFTTTVGLYMINKGWLEEFSDILGYINEPITGDIYDDINKTISYAVLEDKVSLDQFKRFIMLPQIYMSCASAISPSHTEKLFSVSGEVEKKKKELLKQDKYKNMTDENGRVIDIKAANDFEKELLDYAKEYLGDDVAADMYNSGARSSWGNNFKNMYVIAGVKSTTDNDFVMLQGSYTSGMRKEDFANVNDAAAGGPYARSRKTAEGGYYEKLFTAATQHIKVGKEGSDCGTPYTIKVQLTKKNIKDWMYSFIKDGSKLVELTSDTVDKYIGKEVNMRFSSLCKAKNGIICEKCMGTLFRRIGIENVGLGSMIMMSAVKNKAMSSFHNSNISLANINPEDIFK